MARNTKQRILDSALELFAERGYAGTNIQDISESVGIVKSAFYRHFESKEEIFGAICNSITEYYNEHFGSEKNIPPIPETAEEFYEMSMRMINFTVNDEKIIMTRKILMTEQFRDKKVCILATEHFNTGIETMFTKIFEEMMKNGLLKNGDAQMLALAYTAPISSLIHFCDREPAKKAELIERMGKFTEHFTDTYFS